jgi:hypothetical protein
VGATSVLRHTQYLTFYRQIGAVCMLIATILLETTPEHHTIYWTYEFFAPLVASLGPDFAFTAAQIIASNTVKASQQGVAGSLVGTTLNCEHPVSSRSVCKSDTML